MHRRKCHDCNESVRFMFNYYDVTELNGESEIITDISYCSKCDHITVDEYENFLCIGKINVHYMNSKWHLYLLDFDELVKSVKSSNNDEFSTGNFKWTTIDQPIDQPIDNTETRSIREDFSYIKQEPIHINDDNIQLYQSDTKHGIPIENEANFYLLCATGDAQDQDDIYRLVYINFAEPQVMDSLKKLPCGHREITCNCPIPHDNDLGFCYCNKCCISRKELYEKERLAIREKYTSLNVENGVLYLCGMFNHITLDDLERVWDRKRVDTTFVKNIKKINASDNRNISDTRWLFVLVKIVSDCPNCSCVMLNNGFRYSKNNWGNNDTQEYRSEIEQLITKLLTHVRWLDICITALASVDGLEYINQLDEELLRKFIFIPKEWLHKSGICKLISSERWTIIVETHEKYYEK